MVTYDKNIRGRLVRVNNGPIIVPAEMGIARADQLQGTPDEQLCELAGRVCYDSLGTGRDSAGYHSHIGQVKHFSTIEHSAFTVEIDMTAAKDSQTREWVLLALQNRPNIVVNAEPFENKLRVTLDLRHVIEWDKHSELSDTCQSPKMVMNAELLGHEIRCAVESKAPRIVENKGHNVVYENLRVKVVKPETNNEKFVTVFMGGGRGFSHEQVRHRFNMSQRSSRFCDEGDSPIVEHPLITEFLADESVNFELRKVLRDTRQSAHEASRGLYKAGVDALQQWLVDRKVEKTTARKQARGAMRNDLGNGLYTEIIFTANINMWRHMFSMRSTQFADAEIREVYCRLLPEFQGAGLFTSWTMAPAPDGLGHCVVM